MSSPEKIKLFGMSHLMLERDLDQLEQTLSLDLGRDYRGLDDRDDSPPSAPLATRSA